MVRRIFISLLLIVCCVFFGCAKGENGCFDYFGMPALTDCNQSVNDPDKQDTCLLWLTLYQRCRK